MALSTAFTFTYSLGMKVAKLQTSTKRQKH